MFQSWQNFMLIRIRQKLRKDYWFGGGSELKFIEHMDTDISISILFGYLNRILFHLELGYQF